MNQNPVLTVTVDAVDDDIIRFDFAGEAVELSASLFPISVREGDVFALVPTDASKILEEARQRISRLSKISDNEIDL